MYENPEEINDFHLRDPLTNKQISHSNKSQTSCCNTGCTVSSFFSLVFGAGAMFLAIQYLEGGSTITPPTSNLTNSSFGCSLADDTKILLEMNSEILVHQKLCGRANFGVAAKVAVCLEKVTGLSSSCGMVYGQLTECGKKKCMFKCMGGASKECTACICAHCRVSFLKQIKIPCTLVPDGPYSCSDCPGHLPYSPPAPSSSPTLL